MSDLERRLCMGAAVAVAVVVSLYFTAMPWLGSTGTLAVCWVVVAAYYAYLWWSIR